MHESDTLVSSRHFPCIKIAASPGRSVQKSLVHSQATPRGWTCMHACAFQAVRRRSLRNDERLTPQPGHFGPPDQDIVLVACKALVLLQIFQQGIKLFQLVEVTKRHKNVKVLALFSKILAFLNTLFFCAAASDCEAQNSASMNLHSKKIHTSGHLGFKLF